MHEQRNVVVAHSSSHSVYMPLIRKLDHVLHGPNINFGERYTQSGLVRYRPTGLNGGFIHSTRYVKWAHRGHGIMGRGIMGKGIPETELIPTPYNVQLPGGTMKRPREMSKAEVIRKMAKLRS
jgi:hypothetical protein